MHSDVSIYVAFSGEFFIRRLLRRKRSAPEDTGFGGRNDDERSNGEDEGRAEGNDKDERRQTLSIARLRRIVLSAPVTLVI